MILVTGASGFIGRTLCAELSIRGYPFRGVVRKINPHIAVDKHFEFMQLGNINANTDWSSALKGINCIIHCAALVHLKEENKAGSSISYQSVNVDATYQLAKQAAAAGVKRFVYLSSVKVLGKNSNVLSKKFNFSRTCANSILTNEVFPNPVDGYGISKWKAEQALWDVSSKSKLEVVIIRSPLVYGPGVKGNMERLLRLVQLGIPLPLGGIKNKRSLIAIDNLIDLLIRCIKHNKAVRKTFLVSDGEDLSTTELLFKISVALGRNPRIFSVPLPLLYYTGKYLGKSAEIERLVGSLRVDNSYSCKLLDWKPVVNVEEGIRRMVQKL